MPLSRRRFLSVASATAGLTVASLAGPRSALAAGSSFTVAVIPDTQQEVFGSDRRFAQRTQWLADNRSALGLAFVAHTGDVVNWDTPDHSQYAVASQAFENLDRAGIPWLPSIGNHDTAAVGVGGSAADPRRTRALVRDTTTFNDYFPTARMRALSGTFENGKIDNAYSTFTAGGAQWMLLSLELWPRAAAVAWADAVLAAHPRHNVILSTHSYLNGDGTVYGRADYGDTSPQQLLDQLIRPRANVKIVLSGHVGLAGHRVDTHTDGSRFASFLGTFHSNSTNPVQLLTVDPDAGTIATRFTAPANNQSWPEYATTIDGMSFSRSSDGGESSRAVALQARVNARFVTAEAGGLQPLIANRHGVGLWETFDLVTLANGGSALRSRANSRFVCADGAGSLPLIANRDSVGSWETFDVVPTGGGDALRSRANGLFVCADGAGSQPLQANRAAAGLWETLVIVGA